MSEIPESYLDELNPQQREAVEYCDGPQLVIAGAGSGKTRVLTYKILHLLRQGYEPWRLLALTFTNKAAREMRQRIEQLAGPQVAARLWMGTFHSIFARILRAHADLIGYKRDYTIYDASDSKSLVKTIIRDLDLDEKTYKPSVVLSAISWAKNSLISPEAYMADSELYQMDMKARRPLIGEIYRGYRDRCRVAGAMDFDDLLFNTNVLLRDHPDVMRHYREFFRYVLVDEYQDTNFAQHLIVKAIAGEAGKLCVVGDDAQSIYSFRGANIRNILDLRNSYPSLVTNKLEQNYRSTQNIIDAAGSLIKKNVDQIPKDVFSKNEKGAPLEIVRCYSDFEEAYQIVAKIAARRMLTSDSYDEFAVLYRTNAQSRVLEEALRKRNIPYRIYGGLSFYQRKEIKDATAYFRLALNPDDDEALRRVINFPARGIGDTTLKKLIHAAYERNSSLWHVLTEVSPADIGLNRGTAAKLQAFVDLVKDFQAKNASGANAFEVAREIITRTGMVTMLMHDKTPESISKIDNLEELLNGVREFVDTHIEEGDGDDVSLARYMGEISLATDQDSDDPEGGERITLMTVHAAKGLEFNNVFIVGAEEELFPSAMASDSPAQVEEERRLMYVAITRARRFCLISYASSRFRNGMTASCRPSRFIREIDPRYISVTSDVTDNFRPEPFYSPSERRGFSSHGSLATGSAKPLSKVRGISADPPKPSAAPSAAPSSPDDARFTIHVAAEFSVGTVVEHQKFGRGVVTSVQKKGADSRITVQFSATDTRTLMLRFAKLAIL